MEIPYFTSSPLVPVRKEPDEASEMVTQLLFGDLLSSGIEKGNWLNIKTLDDDYPGWVDKRMLSRIDAFPDESNQGWFVGDPYLPARVEPVYGKSYTLKLSLGMSVPALYESVSDEKLFTFKLQGRRIQIPRQGLIKARKATGNEIVEVSRLYLGAPYLWGGKSIWGIDCSGLTQMAYRLCGMKLPRDSSQQEKLGIPVAFPEKREGDLAFFASDSGKVTHVGVILSEGLILHASGRVREDKLEAEGIFNVENQGITHKLLTIKRYI